MGLNEKNEISPRRITTQHTPTCEKYNICYYKQMLYFSKARLERLRKDRITQRYNLSGQPTTEERVRRLLKVDRHFGSVLRACVSVAEERGEETKRTENSGRFAGAWVIQSLRVAGIPPPNNLRALSSIGLIKLASTTRSGNRAYYTIPDAKGIARALKNLTERKKNLI